MTKAFPGGRGGGSGGGKFQGLGGVNPTIPKAGAEHRVGGPPEAGFHGRHFSGGTLAAAWRRSCVLLPPNKIIEYKNMLSYCRFLSADRPSDVGRVSSRAR